jgi:hypothetical protein
MQSPRNALSVQAALPCVQHLNAPKMGVLIMAAAKRPPHAGNFKHHLDARAREILDRLADDLDDDTLMTTQETASWLSVSKQFLELGRMQGYGPPATVLSEKVVRYRKNSVLRWLIERERDFSKRAKAG